MNLQRELPRMDLRFAKLCMELDCNSVFHSATFQNCPTCGSVECYPIESWLNRERSETPSVVIGNVNMDGAARVAAMPRPLWLERLRAKRVENDARSAAGPAKIQTLVRRRRVS